MSVQTLYTASTGMQALETKLDVIANNMANINTTAFKKDRANFEDLFYHQYRLPGSQDKDGNRSSTGIEVGLGVRVSSTQSDFDQGAFLTTNNQLDLAIKGKGFFEVEDPNGGKLYTRAGNFGVNADNKLVLGSADTGWKLVPEITIPENAIEVNVDATGAVKYATANSSDLTSAGQIQLTRFADPDGLLKLGDNLYRPTEASGAGAAADAAEPGYGVILQGFLEASNVEPVNELIDLITTQRAFELNSQVVQAGDQMMQTIANLRRG